MLFGCCTNFLTCDKGSENLLLQHLGFLQSGDDEGDEHQLCDDARHSGEERAGQEGREREARAGQARQHEADRAPDEAASHHGCREGGVGHGQGVLHPAVEPAGHGAVSCQLKSHRNGDGEHRGHPEEHRAEQRGRKAHSQTPGPAQLAASVADEVIGVEIVEEAVEAAKQNAALNNLSNCKFIAGDVLKVLDDLTEKPDVIILDPPRDGIHPKALPKILSYGVDHIVYISCKATSLARDLPAFLAAGYKLEKACCVDQFCQTVHVETVVLLSHKKPDGHINVKVEFGEGEGKVPLDNIAKRAETYKPKERVTYKMIKEYIEAKYGFKVHTAYIAEVKRDLGLPMYDAPNAVEELKQPRKHPTVEKVEAIKDALKHFEVI